MVYIFDKFDDYDDETYKKLFKKLPPSQKQKVLKRKNNPLCARITILEYFVLKSLLKFEGFPDFEYNENGKPLLNGYNFSISHSENVLCIATAASPVGVDIEKIITYKENLARFISNDDELQYIQNHPDKNLALTQIYTKKEATIKCLGKNLGYIKNKKSEECGYHFYRYNNFIIALALRK